MTVISESVLSDVRRVMEIANPRDAASCLDGDEKNTVVITDGVGRPRQNTIINESGLYSLVLTSRQGCCRAFRMMLRYSRDVLLSSQDVRRKYGFYYFG
ncbi:MAG TPA: BRO family protein [Anaerolineales bacterium]|nr:BRO family protein [Anaerolineales bacterium]